MTMALYKRFTYLLAYLLTYTSLFIARGHGVIIVLSWGGGGMAARCAAVPSVRGKRMSVKLFLQTVTNSAVAPGINH